MEKLPKARHDERKEGNVKGLTYLVLESDIVNGQVCVDLW